MQGDRTTKALLAICGAGLFGNLAWSMLHSVPAHAQSTQSRPKWEYIISRDVKVSEWNLMGSDGWEMVQLAPTPEGPINVVFKRAKLARPLQGADSDR